MAFPTVHTLDAPPVELVGDTKAKAESVQSRFTRQDATIDPVGSQMFVNLVGGGDGLIPWSYYPQNRDRQLRKAYKLEPMMAGAVYSLTARIKSLRWRLEGGRNLKVRFQNVMATADDGAGWAEFIGKVITDLLTQDNGAFIELIGPGNPLKQLPYVTKVAHLDSANCWRTHDPEYPVIYQNPMTGQLHMMHRSRVIALSSFPQPNELARSVGFCGVSRGLGLMQYMKAVQQFKNEKVSGNFKRAVIWGSGWTAKTWNTAMSQADEDSDAKGVTYYRGIPVLLTQHDKAMLEMLDLASLPDGFEYESETTLYIYMLALVFGVDAREFWPATASGATKADASIQHLKAQGKGFADLIQTIEDAINWHILPGGLSFKFDYTDDEQDRRAEEVRALKSDNIQKLVDMGVLDKRGAQILCVLRGVLDAKELDVIMQAGNLGDSGEVDGEAPIGPDGDEILLPPLPEEPPPTNPFPPQGGSDQPVPPQGNQKDIHPTNGQKMNVVEDYDDLFTLQSELQDKLETLLVDWGGKLAKSPSPLSVIDAKLDELYNSVIDEIVRYTSAAFRMGGGSSDDEGRLKQVGAKQAAYFRYSFMPDLRLAIQGALNSNTGTKDDSDPVIQAIGGLIGRIRQYASAAWESFWHGFGQGEKEYNGPAQNEIKRELDPYADNCDDCPKIQGIYDSYEAMYLKIGLPGDGSTQCKSNCHCVLYVESKPGSSQFIRLPGKGPSIDYTPLYDITIGDADQYREDFGVE